jgi:hypothetical protein
MPDQNGRTPDRPRTPYAAARAVQSGGDPPREHDGVIRHRGVTVLSPDSVIVTVTARTVQIRDCILIGGQPRKVTDIRAVHGGSQLSLHTGERLIIALRQEYTVSRPVPKRTRWEGR